MGILGESGLNKLAAWGSSVGLHATRRATVEAASAPVPLRRLLGAQEMLLSEELATSALRLGKWR